ncbi:ABC transporter permease [Luteolibacter yonseiensis]|uniref:Transport permease protein n=1 Tax=Luteolibacter yonseiensis TaxID=1144680 RepID=A0A934V6S9_9BACT|nr:ABC transporter permease [Luteolibacter yonseiensis]MBK1815377.1 ABC transporter permease [Luteolibacter yonseiensis]
MPFSINTVQALVLRYLYLYTRHPIRLVELIFWPLVDLLVWGFLTTYLKGHGEGGFPSSIGFLIGGMILWDVLFRSQQGVAISFLEDVWTRNLLNVFVAPVRTAEYVASTCVVGVLRVGVTLVVLTIVAALAYQFQLTNLGLGLLPFLGNLILFGWFLGMISTALIMRFGQAAESLAWAIPFFIQPLAAVFYPVSVLPSWLQPAAMALPCTPVFEGMRTVLSGKPVPWGNVEHALLLNLVWGAVAAIFFAMNLRHVRKSGLLVKVATQ